MSTPIENRGTLFAPLTCKCGQSFMGNIYSVVCFEGVPHCLRCVRAINDLRERLDLPTWGIPANAYPEE